MSRYLGKITEAPENWIGIGDPRSDGWGAFIETLQEIAKAPAAVSFIAATVTAWKSR